MEAYIIIGFITLIPAVLLGWPILVEKLKNEIEFRNEVLAFAYLIKDLGPDVVAFSVVSIFTTQPESTNVLITVVFVGIGVHILGRKLIAFIYKISKNDKGKWKNIMDNMMKEEEK